MVSYRPRFSPTQAYSEGAGGTAARHLPVSHPMVPTLSEPHKNGSSVARSGCRREYGLWVAFGEPGAQRVNDEEAYDEESDARENLDAAFLRFEAHLTGGSQQEHERERVQAVHEPVRLGLCERQHERDGGDRGKYACGRIEDRHGDRGGDPERSTDRLSPYPVAFSHDDVEHQDEDRLRYPVGLGPSQCDADHRAATQDDAEHDRHDRGDGHGKV